MMRTVMIVEDEDLIRSLCADVFRDAGFQVMEVASGDEALHALQAGKQIDAIVSDIRMPGSTDGMALRAAVEREWPDIKMLLTSGHMKVERSELSQNHLFVPKPYQFLELVRQLEDLFAASA